MGCAASTGVADPEKTCAVVQSLQQTPQQAHLGESLLPYLSRGQPLVVKSISWLAGHMTLADGTVLGQFWRQGKTCGFDDGRGTSVMITPGAYTIFSAGLNYCHGKPATVLCNRPRPPFQAVANTCHGNQVAYYPWAVIKPTGGRGTGVSRNVPWGSLGIFLLGADGISFAAKPAVVVTKIGWLGGFQLTNGCGEPIGVVSQPARDGRRQITIVVAAGVDPLLVALVIGEWHNFQYANRGPG